MRKLSCIIRHKWEYRSESCLFYPPKNVLASPLFGNGTYTGPCDSSGNPIPVPYDRDVRMCSRCKKKEMKYSTFKVDDPRWKHTWVDCELTKEDIRDNKLEQIGI